MTNSLTPFYGAAVNNSLLDPFQGFDVEVYAADQATGKYFLTGRFTSIQLTIRNSTEPYLEFNQRSPRYLEGEFQIGFVLERGMIDARVMAQTYGVNAIRRDLRLNRGPRMQIAFEISADSLHNVSAGGGGFTRERQNIEQGYANTGELIPNIDSSINQSGESIRRQAKGRYVMSYCKMDSLTIGATAGRSVVANRWEGLAEDIEFIAESNIWSGTNLDLSAARSADNASRSLLGGTGGQNVGFPFGTSSAGGFVNAG